jgi:hypothetical protein
MPVRTILSLVLVLASASPAIAAPATAPAGIAYDEVDYFAAPRTARPVPDFAAHYAAAQASSPIQASAIAAGSQSQAGPRRRGVAGAIAAAAAASALGSLPGIGGAIGAQAAQAAVRAAIDGATSGGATVKPIGSVLVGHVSRWAFSNGWVRAEMPSMNRVTIMKPDRKEIVMLDTAAKTYTRLPWDETAATYDEKVLARAVFDVSNPTTSRAAVQPIGGVPANGLLTRSHVTVSAVSGVPCKASSYELVTTTYYASDIIAPAIAQANDARAGLAAPPGCAPATGPAAADPHLALFRVVDLNGGVSSLDHSDPLQRMLSGIRAPLVDDVGMPKPGVEPMRTWVTERGNLRTLSAADANLFEIPSDYREAR